MEPNIQATKLNRARIISYLILGLCIISIVSEIIRLESFKQCKQDCYYSNPYDTYVIYDSIGAGIWGSFFGWLAGAFGLLAGCSPCSRSFLTTHYVMCFIQFFAGIIISSFDLVLFTVPGNINRASTSGLVADISLMILSFVCLIGGFHALQCCASCCNSCATCRDTETLDDTGDFPLPASVPVITPKDNRFIGIQIISDGTGQFYPLNGANVSVLKSLNGFTAVMTDSAGTTHGRVNEANKPFISNREWFMGIQLITGDNVQFFSKDDENVSLIDTPAGYMAALTRSSTNQKSNVQITGNVPIAGKSIIPSAPDASPPPYSKAGMYPNTGV